MAAMGKSSSQMDLQKIWEKTKEGLKNSESKDKETLTQRTSITCIR